MMNIFYSVSKQKQTDQNGFPVQPTEHLILYYGKKESFRLKISDRPELFSDDLCWTASVWNAEDSTILCTIPDEDFDASEWENGILTFSLSTSTTPFFNAVQNRDVHGWLEVNGTDQEGTSVFLMRFRVLAVFSNDPESIPEDITYDIATMSWVKKFVSGEEVDFLVTKDMLDSALSSMAVTAASGTVIPLVHNTIVKHTISADETISFDTAAMTADRSATMELWLTMPETVVSFTIADVVWLEEPSFDTGNMLYAVVVRWDGEKVIANPAYALEVI